jgi:peptide deformylase
MILEIVQYGHPALRAKGRRVEKIDTKIRQLAEDMLETMVDADGVGLAAQQVGLPLLLFVVDVSDVTDRKSALRINGETVDINDHMPMALVNPEVEPYGKEQAGPEGCLSIPGIRADVIRPGSVRVKAQDLEGNTIEFEADGLLARAVQHENDHLNGILFLDHLDSKTRDECLRELEESL